RSSHSPILPLSHSFASEEAGPATGKGRKAEPGMDSGKAFAFGKNWRAFIDRYLSEERLAEAKHSLVAFSGGEEAIRGRSFLDIGCGSGLFSLAAHQLGAARVTSFDIDPDSV